MDSKAVSEVIGALMLITIVVISASALGYYLAIVQKEEIERESHLRAVESEKLDIVNVELDQKERLFEIVNRTSGEVYGISLNCEKDCYFQICGQECRIVKIYGDKLLGRMNATLKDEKIFLNENGDWEFRISKWNILNITVRNLNTQDSIIKGIKLNNKWVKEWKVNGNVYNISNPLKIPAKSGVEISIGIDSLEISRNEPLTVELMTGLYNFFTFRLNVPDVEVGVEARVEEYSTYSREVFKFSNTKSNSFENIWILYIHTSDGNLMIPKIGISMNYAPEILLTSPYFSDINICNLNLNKFSLQAIVIDSKGILSLSEVKSISTRDVDPPTIIKTSYNQNKIAVKIENAFGCGKSGEVVFFTPFGNTTLNKTVAITNESGEAFVEFNGDGIVEVKCRNLVKHLEIRESE